MSDNMDTIFKIFDPCVLGPYPTYAPEVVDEAFVLLNQMRIGKPIEARNEKSVELLKRACMRSNLKLTHFIQRANGLGVQPDTTAPKDVVDSIVFNLIVNDAATSIPYEMVYVQNQDPSVVAASLRHAQVVLEEYIKKLDIKSK